MAEANANSNPSFPAGGAPGLPGGPKSGNPLDQQVMFTAVDEFLAWGKENSLFYLLFATACCGIELMQAGGPRYDVDRLGMIPRATPRQADLLMVVGTVTHKQAPVLRKVYEQMCEPKWVMAFGVCATSGGFYQNYAAVQGIDKVIPVDVYIPGCPPRPEMVIDGIMQLQQKIATSRHPIVTERF